MFRQQQKMAYNVFVVNTSETVFSIVMYQVHASGRASIGLEKNKVIRWSFASSESSFSNGKVPPFQFFKRCVKTQNIMNF